MTSTLILACRCALEVVGALFVFFVCLQFVSEHTTVMSSDGKAERIQQHYDECVTKNMKPIQTPLLDIVCRDIRFPAVRYNKEG